MNGTVIKVQMLGELTLTLGDKSISETQNRTKKMWALMAYLLYHRHRTVSRDELLDLLWGNGSGQNPVSAMKTALHRTRLLLDDLYPGAGHELIIQKDGGYCWNPEIPLEIDIDQFQSLCINSFDSPEVQIEHWTEALELYRGNFLSHMASELWVIPIAAYYQNLYIKTAQKLLPLLERQSHPELVADLCSGVLAIDPCNEKIHRHMMRAKIAQGNQSAAMQLYEDLSRRLAADFGVMPEEATRSLYREAMQTVGEQYLPIEVVQTHLKEAEGLTGAMLCDYSFFQMLCYSHARAMSRVQMDVHVGLFSITDHSGKALSKQDLTKIMPLLERKIQGGLRRGDAIARCSASQYIILLPYANYQNSCMVCERVIQAFFQETLPVPASIQYVVHGLEPYM